MIGRAIASILVAGALGFCAAGCSLGDGTGDVKSTSLFAETCWEGQYDLRPDFFAAIPYRDTMQIRVQRGSDLEDRSDGLVVLIDDVAGVRKNQIGVPIEVSLPKGVAPPGVPPGQLCGDACNSGVHASLYLLGSCHNENTVLYALSGTITFTELFSGDPNEKDAAKKLSEADFDIMVGNPQTVEEADGVFTVPNQSEVTGHFRFFFQRGQPAQPFP